MTTANPWSRLPNARHIDRVLASLKADPAKWSAARDAARGAARDAARGAALDAARDAARGARYAAAAAAWDAARAAARDARDAARAAAWDARDAARNAAAAAAWDAARDAARGARDAARGARDAVSALTAWDDCAYMLDWPEVQVRAHYELTGDPAALLLLPAAIVFSQGETV